MDHEAIKSELHAMLAQSCAQTNCAPERFSPVTVNAPLGDGRIVCAASCGRCGQTASVARGIDFSEVDAADRAADHILSELAVVGSEGKFVEAREAGVELVNLTPHAHVSNSQTDALNGERDNAHAQEQDAIDPEWQEVE